MTSGPVVLNVNDHVGNLYMVTRMLRNAGFRVLEARTGGEALACVATANPRPELVLLDVRLPDISGFEVCRRLEADPATRDIKVLHSSAAFVTSTSKVEGLDAGADGYLTQPFEPPDLIATVRSLLRLRAVEVDLQERNDALLVADRRKDEFLAMLAHELRNPLAAPAAEPDAPPPCRVLVVDDDEDGRQMLRALCELDGHEVIEAADGHQGVERALAARPDIAFVDIGLPGLDGYEVARRVRARRDGALRLVALSGHSSAAHRAQALEAGFDEHVAKPMSRAQLRRCIAATAGRRLAG